MRENQEPVRTDGGQHDDYVEDHPAFGVAIVSRGSGTGRSLFQSDLLHNETISFSIRHAQRTRSLIRDWIFPREEVVEVEMSLAQWGSLVSSIGIGSGVPVTIRSLPSNRIVPGIPFAPRTAEAVSEAKGSVNRLMAKVRERLATLTEAIESKQGVRATREALNALRNTVEHADSSVGFAVKQVNEATESVVAQAKTDIESHILAAARATGLDGPFERPQLTFDARPAKEIDS